MDQITNKQWAGLTITDELPIGVFYAGLRHKRFTLRVGLAGDLISAQQEYPEGPLQLVTLEVFRRQLLTLGDIPTESITTDLLRSALAETDLAAIAKADEALEKKLMPQSAASLTGGALSTSSCATAIDSMKSSE
jgi:phage FluMu protein gp41